MCSRIPEWGQILIYPFFHISIYNVHDDAKDKDFELELSWICAESKNLHQFVPKDIAEEAERLAKVIIRKKMILVMYEVDVKAILF